MTRASSRPAGISASATPPRITAAALSAFGTRGYEATSLDHLAAELGLTKQTILYWFGSKEGLLAAVVDQVVGELVTAMEAAPDAAGHGYEHVEAVLAAVFRVGVRQPAVLGLLREVNRLGPEVAEGVASALRPLVERAAAFLEAEMAAGTIRRADGRMLVLFVYAAVVGAATEAEAQRLVGYEPSVASLRRLRRELFAFVRAALAPDR